MIAWVVTMPHTFEMFWSYAVVGGVTYALVTIVMAARSRRKEAQFCSSRCGYDDGRADGPALKQVSNAVNTASGRPVFAQVGASARWPGLWIGAAVHQKPAAALPAQPADGLQRRRLSPRSVISMSHQKGSR